jgi:hypothetical protein
MTRNLIKSLVGRGLNEFAPPRQLNRSVSIRTHNFGGGPEENGEAASLPNKKMAGKQGGRR